MNKIIYTALLIGLTSSAVVSAQTAKTTGVKALTAKAALNTAVTKGMVGEVDPTITNIILNDTSAAYDTLAATDTDFGNLVGSAMDANSYEYQYTNYGQNLSALGTDLSQCQQGILCDLEAPGMQALITTMEEQLKAANDSFPLLPPASKLSGDLKTLGSLVTSLEGDLSSVYANLGYFVNAVNDATATYAAAIQLTQNTQKTKAAAKK